MTAKEAYIKLKDKYPMFSAIKGYEYRTVFVFQVKNDKVLDSLISVDKQTEDVRTFKPFFIPIDEYKAGRLMANSEYL